MLNIKTKDILLDSQISKNERIIEAVLFSTEKPISENILSKYLPEGINIKLILSNLKKLYEGRGIELAKVANSWSFRTSPDLSDDISFQSKKERKLSKAALETLAIIAYHQPITRPEIENLRGVSSSTGTIDILIAEGWVEPKGKKRVPGRPSLWHTTTNFLDYFALSSLDDLPGTEELKSSGLLGAQVRENSIFSFNNETNMMNNSKEAKIDEVA